MQCLPHSYHQHVNVCLSLYNTVPSGKHAALIKRVFVSRQSESVHSSIIHILIQRPRLYGYKRGRNKLYSATRQTPTRIDRGEMAVHENYLVV